MLTPLKGAPRFAIAPKPRPSRFAPTVATIGTGGGGGTLGAMLAGFRPLWGIDCDPMQPERSHALATAYEANFGTHLIRKTIQQVIDDGEIFRLSRPDSLFVTLPCRNFAICYTEGKESAEDITAAQATAMAIQYLQPQALVFENVPTWRNSVSWQYLYTTLLECGYTVNAQVLTASDYGVPQKRRRFIVRAILGQPMPPLPRKWKKPMSWLEAIADLLPNLPQCQLTPKQTAFLASNPEKFRPPLLIERIGYFTTPKIRRANEPSFCIRAAISTDAKRANRHNFINIVFEDERVVHLTSHALARLQSFPDWYELPPLIKDAGPLIGLAVPPLLAKAAFKSLHPFMSPKRIQGT